MFRPRKMLTQVVLVVTLAWPVVGFGYINGGFRSKSEAERYYANPANRHNEKTRRHAEQRAEAELMWQKAEQQRQQSLQQLATLNAAIERDPNDLVAIYQRGKFFQSSAGDRDKAMADFDLIVERDSQFARAYYRRSFLWLWKKDYRRALSDLDEAIRLEPTYPDSHFHRAALLACCPNHAIRSLKDARQSAQAAVDLSAKKLDATASEDTSARAGSNVVVHAYSCGLLAAIAAEMADFPAAILWETEASKFRPRGETHRLGLYQSGRTDPMAVRESAIYLTPIIR